MSPGAHGSCGPSCGPRTVCTARQLGVRGSRPIPFLSWMRQSPGAGIWELLHTWYRWKSPAARAPGHPQTHAGFERNSRPTSQPQSKAGKFIFRPSACATNWPDGNFRVCPASWPMLLYATWRSFMRWRPLAFVRQYSARCGTVGPRRDASSGKAVACWGALPRRRTGCRNEDRERP